MTVHLRLERGPHPDVRRAEIARRAEAMMLALQLHEAELSIVLTDDDQIHNLNKNYRDKDKPTDVLAFAMREGDFARIAGGLLGDVIISIPTARRQAKARSRATLDEVTMLLAHGLLHLLGWDHDTKAKEVRMKKETDRLCALFLHAKSSPRETPRRKRPAKRQSPKGKPARPTGPREGRKRRP